MITEHLQGIVGSEWVSVNGWFISWDTEGGIASKIHNHIAGDCERWGDFSTLDRATDLKNEKIPTRNFSQLTVFLLKIALFFLSCILFILDITWSSGISVWFALQSGATSQKEKKNKKTCRFLLQTPIYKARAILWVYYCILGGKRLLKLKCSYGYLNQNFLSSNPLLWPNVVQKKALNPYNLISVTLCLLILQL